MSYDIEVRYDPDYSQTASLSEIRELIKSSFPVTEIDQHYCVFENERIRVEIGFTPQDEDTEARTDPTDRIVAVDLGVPYPYLDASRNALFQIAFLVANHLDWRVYDPQLDREVDEDETLAPGAPSTPEVQISSIKLPFAIAALALGATISAYIVFWRDIYWRSHEDTFFVLTPTLGLLLIYLTARLLPGATRRGR